MKASILGLLFLLGLFALGMISGDENSSWNDDPCGNLPPIYGSDC